MRSMSGELDLPFEVARARLELALALVASRPATAVVEAKNALRGFEQMGATAYASRASALLRSLGQPVRPAGTREGEAPTTGEQEVLVLVGLGLSNPEIAERLFISRKTVAHHVSHLLRKLGVRNRTGLAAYAMRTRGGQGRPAGAAPGGVGKQAIEDESGDKWW